MKYEVILFDLDGTLTDTGIGITNSVMYALNKFNISVKNRSELYKFIGPPLYKSFKDFYGFSTEKTQLAIKYYREYYSDKGIYENTVYSGMYELLDRLKAQGKILAVTTSKPEKFAKIVIKSNKMDKYFNIVAGASMDDSRTSKAEVVEYALSSLEYTDLSKVVIIGDRKHDIIGAKAVGIDSVGVLFGYGSREELEEYGATYIAKNTEDVYEFVAGE